MSDLNAVKSSIANVKSIQKVTKAMYLISASKSRVAKSQLEKTRSYFHQITSTLAEILAESSDIDTIYVDNAIDTPNAQSLYIVLAGDKGQAGSYNHNILNLLEAKVPKENSTLCVAGLRGRTQIRRKGFHVDSDFIYPVMNPSLLRARDIAEFVDESYLSGKYAKVYIVYTDMISPVKLVPDIFQLLPLTPEDLAHKTPVVGLYEKIDYEPSPKQVFEHLVPHYLKGVIYGAFVDSFTSEQHARMFAMDNAIKSSNDLITTLSRRYNRARQSQITQEITEIVGGIPAE